MLPPARPSAFPAGAARSALAAIAVLAAAACTADGSRQPGGEHDRSGASSAHGATELLAVEPRAFERGRGDCSDAVDGGEVVPCVSVTIASLEVRSAATPALADSVRAFVRSAAFASPLADDDAGGPALDAEAVFEALAREREEVARDDGSMLPWSLGREVTVRCQSSRAVSLVAREYSYTGGAHGLETVRMASFDPRSGRRITLDDLVTDEAAVTRIAERAFRRQREIPAGRSLADAGYIFFEDDRFALPDDLLLCGDTLSFHYDPYEIAPYAMGPVDLALPLREIEAYLRKE